MEALIAQIVEKTGVSEEIAQSIIGMVADNMKEKLPAPMQGMVDQYLGGGGDDAGGGLGGGLGGMIGGMLNK